MKLFILVIFGAFALSFVCKALMISIADYPRRVSLGSDVVGLIETLLWMAWATAVLWII